MFIQGIFRIGEYSNLLVLLNSAWYKYLKAVNISNRQSDCAGLFFEEYFKVVSNPNNSFNLNQSWLLSRLSYCSLVRYSHYSNFGAVYVQVFENTIIDVKWINLNCLIVLCYKNWIKHQSDVTSSVTNKFVFHRACLSVISSDPWENTPSRPLTREAAAAGAAWDAKHTLLKETR